MRLCKHARYKTITHILEPKYSTDEILISTAAIDDNIEHYIVKFVKCNKYPDWFYCNGSVLRRHRKQKNGRGEVYVLPMSKTEPFEPIKNCEHEVF